MTEWKKARKKPIVIEYREPIPEKQIISVIDRVEKGDTYHRFVEVMAELIETREGKLYAYPDKDFIIRGVRGELYPIGRDIFLETYEVLEY